MSALVRNCQGGVAAAGLSSSEQGYLCMMLGEPHFSTQQRSVGSREAEVQVGPLRVITATSIEGCILFPEFGLPPKQEEAQLPHAVHA